MSNTGSTPAKRGSGRGAARGRLPNDGMGKALASGEVLAGAPGSPSATAIVVNEPGAAERARRRSGGAGKALDRDQVLADTTGSSSATLIVGGDRGRGAAGSRRPQNGDTDDDEVLAEAQASPPATDIVSNDQGEGAKGLAGDKVLAETNIGGKAPGSRRGESGGTDEDELLSEAQPTKADALASPSASTVVNRRQRAKIRQQREVTAIRNQCRNIVKMLYGDRGTDVASPLEEALPLADALVVAHPRSTVALSLAGDLHSILSSELFEGIKDADQDVLRQAREHSVLALAYFTEASQLAPRCIVIPVSRGNELTCLAKLGGLQQEVPPEIILPFATEVASLLFLYASGITDLVADVQSEFVRASTMVDPDDPAKHHVWYDLRRRTKTHGKGHRRTKNAQGHGYELIHSSPKENITKARAEATRNLERIMESVCDNLVPGKVKEILHQIVTGDLAAARVEATNLAAKYGYCARARILAGYVEAQYITTVDGPQRLAMLRELIGMLHEASAHFKRSIVIAKFLAELYSAVDKDEFAATVVRRALLVHNPDDPREQDVPVGCTQGDCPEHRISNLQEQLHKMLADIEAKPRTSHPIGLLGSQEEDVTPVDDESPANGKQQQKKANKNTPVKYAFKYSQNKETRQNRMQKLSRIAEWDDWLQKKRPSPTPADIPPVHIIQQQLVPESEVNLYAEYCQELAQCSKKNFVCHLCCFEGLYCCRVKINDMGNHYLHEHKFRLSQAFKCPEDMCNIGFRTYAEFRRHHYFVHRLTAGWWKLS